MKPTQVKAWPELVDFQPALPVLTDSRRPLNSSVEVDFGAVRTVSSTGVTVFLLQLLRLMNLRGQASVREDYKGNVRDELMQLGAFDVLANLAGSFQPELSPSTSKGDEGSGPVATRISLPVYRLCFKDYPSRRECVRDFVSWLTPQLGPIGEMVEMQVNGLVMLLNEIAKNTADHANADALFGIDAFVVNSSTARLTFAFGDFGIGIKQHITDNLRPEEEHRRKKMSLYEAYRLAIKPGYTSNQSSTLNKGHGMSIIIDAAAALGVNLSVFDAWSRGLLGAVRDVERPTHEAIRRIFHNVGHNVGFFYYGELITRRAP